jgi:hypothetical protein
MQSGWAAGCNHQLSHHTRSWPLRSSPFAYTDAMASDQRNSFYIDLCVWLSSGLQLDCLIRFHAHMSLLFGARVPQWESRHCCYRIAFIRTCEVLINAYLSSRQWWSWLFNKAAIWQIDRFFFAKCVNNAILARRKVEKQLQYAGLQTPCSKL